MSNIEKLKNCQGLEDFATLLGYQAKSLSYILYIIPPDKKYYEFKILKKHGGYRSICAPTEKLKQLQRHLCNYLSKCYEEIYSGKLVLAHGFRKKILSDKKTKLSYGIRTNAEMHKNKRFVLNLDLENFFPSLNFGRVRGFFIQDKNFKLNQKVATIIAQIACYNNQLPQGSPCSPVISNLIGNILDVRLVKLAKKYKCTYSRYVDDITFSTNTKNFPAQLAIKITEGAKWEIGEILLDCIARAGFQINVSKTRMQYKTSRQTVTGLIVNRKVNIKREYVNTVRAMCLSLFKYGEFFRSRGQIGKISELDGMLKYIYYIKSAKVDNEDKSELSISKLYKKFLFYKYFVTNKRPIIICEGKTDKVYLSCAIRQLKKKGLYDSNQPVDFFNHSSQASAIMGISSGIAALKAFIITYAKNTEYLAKFKSIDSPPVIVLFDNDGMEHRKDGIPLVRSAIKELKKIKRELTPKDHVHHIYHNLYVVFIPQRNSKNTQIEDFFTQNVLDIKLGDKSFDPKSEIDTANTYGKNHFAKYIVAKKQEEIDFIGFIDILKLLETDPSGRTLKYMIANYE